MPAAVRVTDDEAGIDTETTVMFELATRAAHGRPPAHQRVAQRSRRIGGAGRTHCDSAFSH